MPDQFRRDTVGYGRLSNCRNESYGGVANPSTNNDALILRKRLFDKIGSEERQTPAYASPSY